LNKNAGENITGCRHTFVKHDKIIPSPDIIGYCQSRLGGKQQ